jgi:hypothetical protein
VAIKLGWTLTATATATWRWTPIVDGGDHLHDAVHVNVVDHDHDQVNVDENSYSAQARESNGVFSCTPRRRARRIACPG